MVKKKKSIAEIIDPTLTYIGPSKYCTLCLEESDDLLNILGKVVCRPCMLEALEIMYSPTRSRNSRLTKWIGC